MKLHLFAILLSVNAATTALAEDIPAKDKDFSCIDRATADRYVRDFNVNVSSFGGMELCDATTDTKKLFNDLQIVADGRFSGTKKNVFIRNIVPSGNYFEWLKENTAGVRRGHDMPTATAYNSGGYFTMQDGWAKLSTLGRVGTIIHEARHTEGYYHTQCDQGPYKDIYTSGCDDGVSQQGSHGVEMEYYSRVVLQGENFHPVYQQMARLMNLGRANFVFNESPMQQSEGLVAQADDKIVMVNEDDEAFEALTLTEANDYRLKRSSFGATLYRGNSAYAVDLYDSEGQLVTDEYSYYKLLLDGRLGDAADLQEVDINNKRYLVALTQAGNLHTYNYGEGRWSSPVKAEDVAMLVNTAPSGEEGLFTVNGEGVVQKLNPGNLQRGQTLAEKWPEDVVDFVNWHNQRLAVDRSGQVLEVNSGKAFVPMAKWRVSQLVRSPLYDAYEQQ